MLGDDEDLDEPRSVPRMTMFAAVAWTAGLGLVTTLLVQITDGVRPGALFDLVNVTACTVVAFSIFLFAMLRVYAPDSSIRDVLGLRAVSPIASGLAVAVGALLAPGLSLIEAAIDKRYPLPAEESDFLEKIMSANSRGERLVLFASVVLVLPLCDELFFRGILFRGIRRGRAEGLAILGSALLYCLSQGPLVGNFRSLPTGLVLGLLAAWLRGRSGSLVPAALAHAALDAVQAMPLVMGKGEVATGGRLAVGGTIAAGVCAWCAALIFARDGRAENGRLLDA